MAEVLSRHTDPTPVKCGDCGWIGREMDCRHGYQHSFQLVHGLLRYDVEPMDYCPKCNSENLTPTDGGDFDISRPLRTRGADSPP